MSVHADHRTGLLEAPAVNQMTAASTRAALEATMAAQVENAMQARMIFDPSPAVDSILEIAVALLATGADKDALAAKLHTLASELAGSNVREGGHEHHASGLLDQGTARLYATGIRTGLTVREAARVLRPHLRLFGEVARGERPRLGVEHAAHAAVRDVIVQLSDRALRGPGLRNQLGEGPHNLLLEITDCEVIA